MHKGVEQDVYRNVPNERENLGFESGDDSEYFILPVHYKKASTINRKGAASS